MVGFTKMFKKEVKCDFPFGSKECGDFLRNTYKDSIDDVIKLDDGLYECILEYDIIVDEINSLESMKKSIEHRIQSEMREFETGFCRDRKITWKKVVKSSFDSKRLKLDKPDIYNDYLKSSCSRVFRLK